MEGLKQSKNPILSKIYGKTDTSVKGKFALFMLSTWKAQP